MDATAVSSSSAQVSGSSKSVHTSSASMASSTKSSAQRAPVPIFPQRLGTSMPALPKRSRPLGTSQLPSTPQLSSSSSQTPALTSPSRTTNAKDSSSSPSQARPRLSPALPKRPRPAGTPVSLSKFRNPGPSLSSAASQSQPSPSQLPAPSLGPITAPLAQNPYPQANDLPPPSIPPPENPYSAEDRSGNTPSLSSQPSSSQVSSSLHPSIPVLSQPPSHQQSTYSQSNFAPSHPMPLPPAPQMPNPYTQTNGHAPPLMALLENTLQPQPPRTHFTPEGKLLPLSGLQLVRTHLEHMRFGSSAEIASLPPVLHASLIPGKEERSALVRVKDGDKNRAEAMFLPYPSPAPSPHPHLHSIPSTHLELARAQINLCARSGCAAVLSPRVGPVGAGVFCKRCAEALSATGAETLVSTGSLPSPSPVASSSSSSSTTPVPTTIPRQRSVKTPRLKYKERIELLDRERKEGRRGKGKQRAVRGAGGAEGGGAMIQPPVVPGIPRMGFDAYANTASSMVESSETSCSTESVTKPDIALTSSSKFTNGTNSLIHMEVKQEQESLELGLGGVFLGLELGADSMDADDDDDEDVDMELAYPEPEDGIKPSVKPEPLASSLPPVPTPVVLPVSTPASPLYSTTPIVPRLLQQRQLGKGEQDLKDEEAGLPISLSRPRSRPVSAMGDVYCGAGERTNANTRQLNAITVPSQAEAPAQLARVCITPSCLACLPPDSAGRRCLRCVMQAWKERTRGGAEQGGGGDVDNSPRLSRSGSGSTQAEVASVLRKDKGKGKGKGKAVSWADLLEDGGVKERAGVEISASSTPVSCQTSSSSPSSATSLKVKLRIPRRLPQTSGAAVSVDDVKGKQDLMIQVLEGSTSTTGMGMGSEREKERREQDQMAVEDDVKREAEVRVALEKDMDVVETSEETAPPASSSLVEGYAETQDVVMANISQVEQAADASSADSLQDSLLASPRASAENGQPIVEDDRASTDDGPDKFPEAGDLTLESSSVSGWESDLTELSESLDEGDSDTDSSSSSESEPRPARILTGLKIRIPARPFAAARNATLQNAALQNRTQNNAPSQSVNRCTIKACNQVLPAGYRWKCCVMCRARTREYQRRRQNLQGKHSRLDQEVELFQSGGGVRDVDPESATGPLELPPVDSSVSVVPGAQLCSVKHCTHIIPPPSEYKWKMCAYCRKRTRDRRKKNEAKSRLAAGLSSVEEIESDVDVRALKPLPGRCLSLDCGMVVDPSSSSAECRQCVARKLTIVGNGDKKRGRAQVKKKQKLGGIGTVYLSLATSSSERLARLRSCPDKPRNPSPYLWYKCLPALLAEFKVRFSGFLKAQSYYILCKSQISLEKPPDAAIFGFDAEYSVVALDFNIGYRKDEILNGVTSIREEVEQMGSLYFRPERYVSVLPNGGIITRYTCDHQAPIFLPTSTSHEQPPVPLYLKSMKGELEISVLPDHSHRFLPGQKTILRFRLVG